VNLNIQRRGKAASIIIRTRQVITALRTNKLATLRFEPFGANRTEIAGMLFGLLPLAGIHAMHATIRVYTHDSFHGPKVIAYPGWRGKSGDKVCLSSIIMSPPNGYVKMSPYGDIHVEPERIAASSGDFILREGGPGVCQSRLTT